MSPSQRAAAVQPVPGGPLPYRAPDRSSQAQQSCRGSRGESRSRAQQAATQTRGDHPQRSRAAGRGAARSRRGAVDRADRGGAPPPRDGASRRPSGRGRVALRYTAQPGSSNLVHRMYAGRRSQSRPAAAHPCRAGGSSLRGACSVPAHGAARGAESVGAVGA